MTHFLGYAKQFWNKNWYNGNLDRVGPWWGTESDYTSGKVEYGDVLWIVVTGGPKHPTEWRLLQRIEIVEPDFDKKHRFPYRLNGDPEKSKVFILTRQKDFAPVLRRLEFASGKRIQLSGRKIGLVLQSLRPLAEEDVRLLEEYARGLSIYR